MQPDTDTTTAEAPTEPRSLPDLAGELYGLEDDKAHYEHLVTKLNKEIARVEAELAQLMTDLDVAEFTYAGRKHKLDLAVQIRPEADCGHAVVQWIERNGGADLVQPTMHYARRDAFLRENFLDSDGMPLPLPDDLAPLVKVDTLPRVKRPKVRVDA